MNDEIRNYIEKLFAEAPRTKAAYELKEELYANSNERYYDLLKDGVAEDEAMEIVIHSIGDVDQLFAGLEERDRTGNPDEPVTKRVALLRAVAISLYIIGFAAWMLLDEFSGWNIGFIVMLLFAAVATGILVYLGSAYPSYQKKDNTMVEEFKEWNLNKKKRRGIQGAVSTILWMLVLITYFLTSFLTNDWHLTWLIFLAGACLQAIVALVFQLKDGE